MDEARKTSLMWRWFRGGAWVTGAIIVLVAMASLWLLATTSGAQFALDRALAMAGGRVGAVEGRLLGPLSVAAIDVDTPELRLRARGVQLDWSPLLLLGNEVRLKRLHAASLEIETRASDQPASEPTSLALPLRVVVEQAVIGLLRLGTIGKEGGTELRDLSAQLAGDPFAWILGGVEATTPVGRVKLSGTMGARAPFNVDAKLDLAGTRDGAPYSATVQAKGTLAKLEATLAGREGGLAGTGSASLEPLSGTPVRRLVADLDGIDLAAFTSAPHTKLRVEADLAPREGALLAGSVKIVNADPGPVDKDRLPVASVVAQLVIAGDRVEAKDLAVVFAGGGRADGTASWSGGRLDAKVAVRDADLLAWHSSLRATKLAGDITAVATAGEQSFAVALVDPRFQIRAEARIADQRLTVDRAVLSRGTAFAEAKGTLALSGKSEFEASGRIERLDPADFATVPKGELNAVFTAKGNLEAGLAGELDLAIANSRFAGLAAQGRVAVAGAGARIARADATVSLGSTRLVVDGALGGATDQLDVKLASPDLAPLGRAFGTVLGGSIDLEGKISGEFASLSGLASVEARNLRLPGDLRVEAITGRVELGAGDAGAANGRMELRGLRRGEAKEALIELASATVNGTRVAHEIRLESRFADDFSARALLDGGVVAGQRLPEWRGRLESLETTGRAAFALSAPATLTVSGDRIELGEALFGGEPGELRLALTRWTPAGFESRGTTSAVVIRTIRQILKMQGPVASNLVLAGAWDVRVGDSVDGYVSLKRERGDVRVGDPRQALGLETLALRADASGGRVRATLEVRGKQAGEWKGEAALVVARGDSGWEVSPVAPIEGRFTVDVPDLSWLATWMGPEARAGGRLKGEGSLSGTAREPNWSGRVEVAGLVLRDPTLGAEVADGTIAIVLEDRQARIERFTLSMPWQPSADAARAIVAAKRPVAGTVTAEGAVDLGTRKGTIRVKSAAYPLTRLDTRFLAVSGEARIDLDGSTTTITGEFTADAGWFGMPASAPPSLSDDVIVDRGIEAPAAARGAERVRLELRVDLGEHLHFRGRGLSTRLAGSLRLAGEVGTNLRTTGTIRAVGGTYDAYGRTLALERGSLNFQGPVDNPGINVLALRKGLPVEAGVEVLGTVARPRVRLYSAPDVPDSEKLAWLVLGRGQGDVTAGDASTLLAAANALLGNDMPSSSRLLGGLGLDDITLGRDDSGTLGTLPQSTVAGRTGAVSAAEVVTVGKSLSDNLYVSYRQGLADAQGSLRIAWQLSRNLQIILRAGYLPGIDAVYRFSFN